MLTIDPSWTLFLDRDGVINRRLPGAYVRHWGEWEWEYRVLNTLPLLTDFFSRTLVVTNQQGIGKGLMTEEDLDLIHQRLLAEVEAVGGQIDKIYHCPDLASKPDHGRKPRRAMADQARADFPAIDFERSIMVGDSRSDLLFGKKLGMYTVLIESNPEEMAQVQAGEADERWASLWAWADSWRLKA